MIESLGIVRVVGRRNMPRDLSLFVGVIPHDCWNSPGSARLQGMHTAYSVEEYIVVATGFGRLDTRRERGEPGYRSSSRNLYANLKSPLRRFILRADC